MVDLDAVLGGVREHYTPDAGTQKRVRTAVTVALVAGGAAVASGAATASGKAVATGGATSIVKATTGVIWTKLAVGVSIAVAITGSGVLLWPGVAEVEPPQQRQLPVVASRPAPSHEVVTRDAPVEARAIEAPAPSAPSMPAVTASPGAPQVTSSLNNRIAPAARATLSRKTSDAAEAKPSASSMLDELRLLGDASKALRSGRVEESSRLLQEHARRYPTSTLKSERWGMQLLLRCSQAGGGAADDTRRAAEQFVRNAPSSPLARHIRRECLE